MSRNRLVPDAGTLFIARGSIRRRGGLLSPAAPYRDRFNQHAMSYPLTVSSLACTMALVCLCLAARAGDLGFALA